MTKLLDFGKKVIYTLVCWLYWIGLVCLYIMSKLVGMLEKALHVEKPIISEDL